MLQRVKTSASFENHRLLTWQLTNRGPSCQRPLKNCSGSLRNSCVVKTGLPDFYKMVVTVMKISYQKS